MSTIMPKQKRVQDALKWISEYSKAKDTKQDKLLQEAVFRFNLTPKEEEYLIHLFSKEEKSD